MSEANTVSNSSDSDFTIATLNEWDAPERVAVHELEDSIEMIYKERPLVWGGCCQAERVFKVVFSCKDGKWHKSEPIYGEIEPATEEAYHFEQ